MDIPSIIADKVMSPYYKFSETLDWLLKVDVDKPSDGSTMMLAYTNEDRYQRHKIKTGKFVRKYFGEGRNDKDILRIGSEINAAIFAENKVVELTGEDLRKFYLKSVSGISSCMAYDDTQVYLDIYADNPKNIALATIILPNGSARAIVWTFDDGSRGMDRIYYTSDSACLALQDYKDENDMIKNWSSDKKVTCKIRNGMNSFWPYMDTMNVDIIDDKTCILSTGGSYELSETDGSICGYNFACGECGCVCDGDYMVDNEVYCEVCYDTLFTVCDDCDVACLADDCSLVDDRYVCEECMENYSTCSDCGEIHPNNEMTTVNSGDDVCDDCICNYTFCENCNEYHDSDEIKIVKGIPYCESCFDSYYWECSECGEFISIDIDNVDGLCYDCALERLEMIDE